MCLVFHLVFGPAGQQVNGVRYQGFHGKVDELTHKMGTLENGLEELELVLQRKDAIARM
jgi:hypothetical protein